VQVDCWLVGGRAYSGVERDLIVRRFSSRSSRNESIRDDRSLFLNIPSPESEPTESHLSSACIRCALLLDYSLQILLRSLRTVVEIFL